MKLLFILILIASESLAQFGGSFGPGSQPITTGLVFTEYADAAGPGFPAAWTHTGTGLTYTQGVGIANGCTSACTADYVFASAAVGTGAFDLKWQFYWTAAESTTSGNDGVVVGLSSTPLNAQTSSTVNIITQFQNSGIYYGLRKGVLNTSDTDQSSACVYYAAQGPPALGCFEWPQSAGGVITTETWTAEIQRDGNNNLTWNLWNPNYKGGLVPYWSFTWAITSAYQSTSFQYLFIRGVGGSGSGEAAGVVANLSLVSQVVGIPPSITSIAPSGGSSTIQSGNTLTVTGNNLKSGMTCRVGNGTAKQTCSTTYVSPTQLTLTLPTQTNSATPYSFALIDSSGFIVPYPPGIIYATGSVTSILPMEAGPAGGTVVTVTGTGLCTSPTVTVGGNAASVSGTSVTSMQVTVPANTGGAAGLTRPAFVITCGGVGVTVPSTVSFGYSAHPLLLATSSAGITALQTKFANPAFAAYALPLWRNTLSVPPSVMSVASFNTPPAHTSACSSTPTLPVCTVLFYGAVENSNNPAQPGICPPGNGGSAIATCQDTGTAWIPSATVYLDSSVTAATTPFDAGWLAALTGSSQWLNVWWGLLSTPGNRISFDGGSTPQLGGWIDSIDYADQGGDSSFPIEGAGILAEQYDALYPQLSQSQIILFEQFFTRVLSYCTAIQAIASTTQNTAKCDVAGCSNRAAMYSSACGEVALAMYTSYSGAHTIVTAAGTSVGGTNSWGNKLVGADGMAWEGSQYASFGGIAVTRFGRALINAYSVLGGTPWSPSDLGIFETNLSVLYKWLQGSVSASGGILQMWNDSFPVYFGAVLASDQCDRYSATEMCYLADWWQNIIAYQDNGFGPRQNKYISRSDYGPYAFMWRSSTTGTWTGATSSPSTNTNWMQLSSSAALQPALRLYVVNESIQNFGGHSQQDAGAFAIGTNTELWDYVGNPGYAIYKKTPQYSLNSTIQVDGNNIGTVTSGDSFDGTVTQDNGTDRAVAVSVTAAYSAGVTSLRRTFVMHTNAGTGQNAVAVLDDITPTGAGAIVSRFQMGFSPTFTGSTGWYSQGVNSQMEAYYFGPSMTPATSTITYTSAAYPDSFVWLNLGNSHLYTVTESYTAAESTQPAITVFCPASVTGTGGLTATVSYTTNTATLTYSDGHVVTFTYSGGVWKPSSI